MQSSSSCVRAGFIAMMPLGLRLRSSPSHLSSPHLDEQKPGSAGADGDDHAAATLKAMQKFAEKYCEITDTYFCSDLEIAATVIKGARPRAGSVAG